MSVCDIIENHIYAFFLFHIRTIQNKYSSYVMGCSSRRTARRVYDWCDGFRTDIGVDYIKEFVLRLQIYRHTVL